MGRDAAGRTIIELAVDDWVLEKLMTFDAAAADLEDGADAEPDADDEEDGPPVLLLELARPKVVRRRRHSWHQPVLLSHMARRATIQLKVHRQLVQSIPLGQANIECLIDALRDVTPPTSRTIRLIDLLEQIRDGGQRAT